MSDIRKLLEPAGVLFRQERYADAAGEIEKVWKSLPEEKVEVPNAYLVVAYAVSIYMKLGDLDSAWRWARVAPLFSESRHNLGEAEFLMGKVAYERGDLQVAKENFQIANSNSGGRIFQGEDKKYKNLLSGESGG